MAAASPRTGDRRWNAAAGVGREIRLPTCLGTCRKAGRVTQYSREELVHWGAAAEGVRRHWGHSHNSQVGHDHVSTPKPKRQGHQGVNALKLAEGTGGKSSTLPNLLNHLSNSLIALPQTFPAWNSHVIDQTETVKITFPPNFQKKNGDAPGRKLLPPKIS